VRDGFLGDDARPLGEILDADAATVAELRLTHAALANRLARVLRLAMGAMGASVEIEGTDLAAVYRESMGRIPCPFGDGVHAKGEVELTDRNTGEVLQFTPLSVHMIAEHGFYQGRGLRYRLEPAEIARLLDR
jgi:hypothetical protein